jgi:hypothetical protein
MHPLTHALAARADPMKIISARLLVATALRKPKHRAARALNFRA